MNFGRHAGLLVLSLFIFASNCSFADDGETDPVATSKALRALLAASNTKIPQSSYCQGNYGQPGNATVKDLLAMELAYLYAGNNSIRGDCKSNHCTVTIAHASGEDVSSAVITFEMAQGKAKIQTLQCVITP